MATGWVQTIQVIPSREVGKVAVVSPYSRSALIEDTPENVAQWLVTTYPNMFKSVEAARELVQRGREIRGVLKGVGYIQQFDTQQI